jgi:hypothetical protein
VREENKTVILETHAVFFLARIKMHWDVDGGNMLLDVNTGSGLTYCGHSCSILIEFWFQVDLFLRTTVLDRTMCSIRLAENETYGSCCVFQVVSVSYWRTQNTRIQPKTKSSRARGELTND